MLGPKRTVMWVDTYASGGDRFTREKERWFNRQVKQLAADSNNLHHIRWGSWARDQKVPFADALHYTTRGRRPGHRGSPMKSPESPAEPSNTPNGPNSRDACARRPLALQSTPRCSSNTHVIRPQVVVLLADRPQDFPIIPTDGRIATQM